MIWLKRFRSALATGLTWAIAWALTGLAIGLLSVLLPWLPWHIFFDVFDAPLPALAIPGFLAGVLFSIVLGIIARRRTFDELSVRQFAIWGAVGGLLLIVIPLALVFTGPGVLSLPGILAVGGVMIALSAASASASLVLARKATNTALPIGKNPTAMPGSTDASRR